MKALLVILTCCGITAAMECPKTSKLTETTITKYHFVAKVTVESVEALLNQNEAILHYKLKLEKYYQGPYVSPWDWSSYYYIPEKITIISRRGDSLCNVTLKPKESYIVIGDQNKVDIVRKFSELTKEEKKRLEEL